MDRGGVRGDGMDGMGWDGCMGRKDGMGWDGVGWETDRIKRSGLRRTGIVLHPSLDDRPFWLSRNKSN